MGEKIQQTMALEVWNLDSPAVMFECLADLVDQNYRGNIACHILKEGDRHWQLELNVDDKPSVVAVLGQTVVLFGGVLESMTPEAYTARF